MPHRPPFRSVTSRQNPIVAAFRDAVSRSSDELVVIEGARLALEAAHAGWTVATLALTEEARTADAASQLIRALPSHTDCVIVSPPVMRAISPAATPSGVVALARRGSAGTDPYGGAEPLVLLADGVQDPGNLGALARAAEAAGASGLVVCGTSAHPFGWKALRGSMGSAFRLPVGVCRTALDAIAAARVRGLRVLALTARQGDSLYDASLRGPVALVAGGEGAGLEAEVVSAADGALTIPMSPPVESLNVAVAAAVALYEAARQRLTHGAPVRRDPL